MSLGCGCVCIRSEEMNDDLYSSMFICLQIRVKVKAKVKGKGKVRVNARLKVWNDVKC